MKRYNGTPIKSIKAINRFFPYVMPNRNGSVVYLDVNLEMENAIAYLKKINKDRPKEEQVKIFDLLLATLHRMYLERPRLNRFIIGNRYYQRNEHIYYFVSKREISDAGDERLIGLSLKPRDGIFEVSKKVRGDIKESKSGKKENDDEKAVEILMKLPRWFVRFFAKFVYKFLDNRDMMPAFLAATDSMHGSAYIANLGSFGVQHPPFHHLYDYGDISLFFVLGGYKKEAVVDQETGEISVKTVIPMKVSIDERIADGVYFNNSFHLFNDFLQNPEKLESFPDDQKDPYPHVKFMRDGSKKK
jgi:2-oxoacid dehydrogenases acyltransferase (catalytic domain)